MSAETELYAALSGAAGITALVSNRIYPDAIPEEVALPALVFSRLSTEPVVSISGQKFAETVRFQITAWGVTRTAADAVAVQVENALQSYWQPAINRSGGFEGELNLFAATLETDWFTTF